MMEWRTIRKAIARDGMGALLLGVLLTAAAPAQVSSYGDKEQGEKGYCGMEIVDH